MKGLILLVSLLAVAAPPPCLLWAYVKEADEIRLWESLVRALASLQVEPILGSRESHPREGVPVYDKVGALADGL